MYLYIMSEERLNSINTKIFERNTPSRTLDPAIDFRGHSTTYTLFPIVDDTVPPMPASCSEFSMSNTFTPGTSAPFYGYATKVDDESRMRNIFMAYQPSYAQSHYIPSSSSDLYQDRNIPNNTHIANPHELLQEVHVANSSVSRITPSKSISFNEDTRQNIKNISCDSIL